MGQVYTGKWEPVENGWGLIDSVAIRPVEPLSLVTDEKFKMIEWEVKDMAVQVVSDFLNKQGYRLMSQQSNPHVDPSIWIVGQSKGPEWGVVRVVRYPENQASRPHNWRDIAAQCSHMSSIGHFASAALSSADQPFKSEHEEVVPLWRGHGMHVNFPGLT